MQLPGATDNGVYAFDAADAELSLLPMAARRALDVAGRHVSLAAWQAAPLRVRQALVALGACATVDAGTVVMQLADAGVAARVQEPVPEPAADVPPPELVEALRPQRSLTAVRWAELHALDRYVLAQLARRAKFERLCVAYDEILATSKRHDVPAAES